ncbi:MAG: erythrose-4-phosphate dehydrogenase [Spirochaetes bacterium]|nr:erythrose-4-phosphate dehydrogenase [Spirochaetota bacterium]
MAFRIGINGYGRIGRCILRALYERNYRNVMEVTAVNDVADSGTMAYLTRHDTIHGRFPLPVSLEDSVLSVGDDRIALSDRSRIEEIPWGEREVDLVLECTGLFGERADAQRHIDAGAGSVLFSYPATPEVDITVVYGVNHQALRRRHRIVSNASCTTNCLVPVIKTVDDAFGVARGLITTIHASMNDQPVIDAYHHTDLRRTRSAGQSIIPVETQLARGINRILPHLEGRFEATAVRVPVVNVSALDIAITVERPTDRDEVNRILSEAAAGPLHGIMGVSDEPLVSCDFNHDPRSSVVDLTQTRVAVGSMVKLFTWFDNEWAYAVRMLDTALAMLTACE